MRIDEHTKHAQGLVVLYESHAAHVGRQVVNNLATPNGAVALVMIPKIEDEVFHIVETLVPLVERLFVDCPDSRCAFSTKVGDQMASDESTRPADQNVVIAHNRLMQSAYRITLPISKFEINAMHLAEKRN
jgi:hypothetical protein